ncbi:hypothetical protein OBK03_06240 [Empedobacter falsenii]
MIQVGTTLMGGAENNIGKIMSFTSLICILMLKSSLHFKIFTGFRKLMLFFSWFAIVIFLITLVGIDLPYYKINAFTLVMQNSFGGESFYKLYGFVVSSTNTVYNFGGLRISRICGPFQEPGHFAIYIGLVMFFEKLILQKFSKGFIIAGLLTFSPNFFLILGITLFYDLLFSENKKTVIVYLLGGFILVSFLLLLSDGLRDQLYYMTIGRNFDTGGNIEEVLDNRAGKQTLEYYNRFVHSPYFLYGRGVEFMSQFGILSDWRGMVLKYGFIGLIFSLIACFRILFFAKNIRLSVFIFLIIILIYLQRSWMFESAFVYLFLVIGLISNNYWLKNKTNLYEIKK